MPPDIVGAINSMKNELASIMRATLTGIGTPAGSAGSGPSGKNINDLMIENNKQLEELTKATVHSRTTIEKQTKDLQSVAAGLAIVGPALSMYAQYSIALPMRLLSGVQGQAAGIALDREKNFGQLITGTLGGILALHPATRTAGYLVAGAGQLGLNAEIGKRVRDLLMPATIRQMGIEYVSGGRLGIDESYMYQYGIRRGDSAARNMRGGAGGSASAISEALNLMGIGPQESASAAMAIMSQGARGYSKFDMNKVVEMTQRGGGAYGFDPVQNAIAVRQAQRLGFSTDEMRQASERTGFHVDQQAAAMQQVRTRTFMLGMSAGNQIFNSATNTTLGQVLGPQAAVQASMKMGQDVAGAASGNDAKEMILFQQFQQANPGASYMDFLEAKTMGSADPRWKNMMAQAAKTFSGMGQMGGLLGVGTGLFQGASADAMSEATKFARENAGEIGVAPLTAEEDAMRTARLGLAKIERGLGIRKEGMKNPDLLQKEAGDAMTKQHNELMLNTASARSLSEATSRAADITEKNLIPALQGVEEALRGSVSRYAARSRERANRNVSNRGGRGPRNDPSDYNPWLD